MTETVTITLEHYKELESYEKQYEIFKDIREDLVKIIKDETFSLDNPIDKKYLTYIQKL